MPPLNVSILNMSGEEAERGFPGVGRNLGFGV